MDIISWLACLPIYQAGKSLEQITDLEDRGGRKTIRRLISPDSTFCNFSAISSICFPITKSETRRGANFLTKDKKSSLHFLFTSSFRLSLTDIRTLKFISSCCCSADSSSLRTDTIILPFFFWAVFLLFILFYLFYHIPIAKTTKM